VQGFLRELRNPMATALSVAGVTALVGGAISYLGILVKLELQMGQVHTKLDEVHTSVKDLSSSLDRKLDLFLDQSTNDRWYNLCLMGLGSTLMYMAAKPR
jgi:hypothetical protein